MKWQAIKNSSWGEEHKQHFPDKKGFVICSRVNGRELIAHASVFGENYALVKEQAQLMESAPELFELVLELVSVCKQNRVSIDMTKINNIISKISRE